MRVMSKGSPPSNNSAAPAAAPTVSLPNSIEIFSPGSRTDSAGRNHVFTPAMLAEMVASYQPALHEAPLTIGHPKDNLPAYGWVKALYINEAGNLAIDADQADTDFLEMLAKGRFKKRSASFYPPEHPDNPTPGKWHLRHVAFLGAQPPAVKGLRDFKDGAPDALVLNFSEQVPTDTPTPIINPKEIAMSDADKLAALQKQLAEKETALAAAQTEIKAAKTAADTAERHAQSFAEAAARQQSVEILSFAESQVQAGRVLPKDKSLLCAAMAMVAKSEKPFEFSEGTTKTEHDSVQVSTWLRGLVERSAPEVQFGEFAAPTPGGRPAAKPQTDVEVDAAARAYMRSKGTADYAEAVAAVCAA